MNTKIAIDFLENNIKCVTFPLTPDKVNKIIDEIIELVKRGERNLDAINEIKQIANKDIFPYADDGERLKYILEEIEISEGGGKK